MPFRFKKSVPPVKALRRVGAERVRAALGWLEQSRRPEAIHEARKDIKKLRATMRLVRGETGRGQYRNIVKRLRRTAVALAPARDARVVMGALEMVAPDAATRFEVLHAILEKQWRRETRRLRRGKSLPLAQRQLRKAGRRLQQLKIKSSGWPALAAGLVDSCQRAQESLEVVRREPSAEHFHAWRKRVKTFWYQLQLLGPAGFPQARRFVDGLEKLGELLGEEHDLVLLGQAIAGIEGAEAAGAARLVPLIAARQARLRRSALHLGMKLLTGTPSAICRSWTEGRRRARGEPISA
jgi:CHAD domain-containing protein